MKKITTLLLLAALPAMAQHIEKRQSGSFTGVEVIGHFDVVLTTKGNEIVIDAEKAESLKKIKTEIKDNTLRIYSDKTAVRGDVTITVPYSKLSAVSLNGSGDITAAGTIKTAQLGIALVGSGDITLPLDADKVSVSLVGSGDIKLSGSGNALNAAVNGSGDLEAGAFKTEDVMIQLMGSGDADVYATQHITASVNGSGDVTYGGNPAKETIKVTGSGSISKK